MNSKIEELLMKAASDESFKNALFENREKILASQDFSLSPQDRMILGSIPASRLNGMIEKFNRQRTSRRAFLKGAAASIAMIGGALILPLSCKESMTCTGARPEPPVVSAAIGPEGDTVVYDYSGKVTLTVPEKALESTVEIYIQAAGLYIPPPENIHFFGEVYSFSPEDINLLKDAIISFPKHIEYDTKVYLLEEDKWNSIPKEDMEGFVTVKIKKFGTYATGYED